MFLRLCLVGRSEATPIKFSPRLPKHDLNKDNNNKQVNKSRGNEDLERFEGGEWGVEIT